MELSELLVPIGALLTAGAVFASLFNRWVKAVIDKAALMDEEEARQINDLANDNERLQQVMTGLQAANATLRADFDEVQQEREALCIRVDAQGQESQRQKAAIEALEKAYNDEAQARERDRQKFEQDRKTWEKERRSLEQRVELLTSEVGHLREELESKTRSLEDLRQKWQGAEIERASLRATNDAYAQQIALVFKLTEKLERLIPSAIEEKPLQ